MVVQNTLLEQLEAAGVKVDVDSYDPEIAKSIPFTPHDATSNQALIGLQVLKPENRPVVVSTIRDQPEGTPHDILTVLHAKFGKLVLPHISGRLLAQTSPSFPNDKAKIVEHAKAYAKAYVAEGIDLDRLCIKIPTTSAGVQAAVVLKKEGILSLGTALFSLPQAIAASQAGMHAISPYFNPCIAHTDAAYWIDSADPATDHPMANRLYQIAQTYKRLAKETGKPQPQIKAAGHITGREIMSCIELECDHVTVLIPPLLDLLSTSTLPPHTPGERDNRISNRVDNPHSVLSDIPTPKNKPSASRVIDLMKSDPFANDTSAEFIIASTDIDYLADGVLDKYNEEDKVTRFNLADAISTFRTAEKKLFEYIEGIQRDIRAEK